MNNLTSDYIAIDTNVFEHLLNPDQNYNDHIDRLLDSLARNTIRLIVDEEGRIENEYANRILPIITNKKSQVSPAKLNMLTLWLGSPISFTKKVSTKNKESLMSEIKKIIRESGTNVDRTFVFVAFYLDRILISNDMQDIVEGPKNRTEDRRLILLRNTKKLRSKNDSASEILTSKEAAERL